MEEIDAGKTRVTSLSAFSGINSLKRLMLRGTMLDSLDGIASISGLESIGLGAVRSHDLTPLNQLQKLKEASFAEDMREDATRDLLNAAFQISFSG